MSEPIEPAGSGATAIDCSEAQAPHTPPPPAAAKSGCSNDHVVCYDNGFDRDLDREPVGTGADQLAQAFKSTALSGGALRAQLPGGEAQADASARSALAPLSPIPPLKGEPTSTAEYASHIPGVSPQQAFAHFTQHTQEVFAAAGIKVRPAPSELHDGDRLMLEEPGESFPPKPPVWAPVEARVDAEAKTVRLVTLDGHPLRGTNDFHFMPDGEGGTNLRQRSEFQGSSAATLFAGTHLFGALERQHEIWRAVHGELAASLQGCK